MYNVDTGKRCQFTDNLIHPVSFVKLRWAVYEIPSGNDIDYIQMERKTDFRLGDRKIPQMVTGGIKIHKL